MREKLEKITRYVIAGGTGALINFLIYFVMLQVFNVWYLLSSICSFTLSIFAGFYLQKYFTFRNSSKDYIYKQMYLFFSFSLINLLINVILLVFFVEILGINQLVAKVLTLGIIAIGSFFVYQNFVFSSKIQIKN